MIAIGLSVGPFVSGNHEKKTAQLLDTMAYVAFRDDYSYEWAKAAGVKTQIVKAFDLAVLFPLAAPMAAAPKVTERVVGISLLPAGYRGATDQLGPDIDFARVVGASLSGSLKERGAKIVYLSLCTNRSSDDRLLSDAFTKACGGISVERFEHNGDPVRTYNKILSCSHIVSMRLHGGIMAYTAGIPFVQIEYHRKCVDFAESIGLADGHRISMNEACDGKLAGRFTDLLKTSSVSARMNLQEAQERARLNFRTISL